MSSLAKIVKVVAILMMLLGLVAIGVGIFMFVAGPGIEVNGQVAGDAAYAGGIIMIVFGVFYLVSGREAHAVHRALLHHRGAEHRRGRSGPAGRRSEHADLQRRLRCRRADRRRCRHQCEEGREEPTAVVPQNAASVKPG